MSTFLLCCYCCGYCCCFHQPRQCAHSMYQSTYNPYSGCTIFIHFTYYPLFICFFNVFHLRNLSARNFWNKFIFLDVFDHLVNLPLSHDCIQNVLFCIHIDWKIKFKLQVRKKDYEKLIYISMNVNYRVQWSRDTHSVP